ncbi:MAG: cytochrome c [Bacteroidetes bacterium]|nr:cytochrome c [Bacteroidota bacterium]
MKLLTALLLAAAFIITGCGGDNKEDQSSSGNATGKEKIAEKLGITVFELDNGIGPIKEKLQISNDIDKIMAESGKKTFESKCAQCHKMDERYTGPALRSVTETRSPEYIMNMILNPQEMTQKHPEARKMLAMYANQMTFQNVTEEDARQLLEYLRMESNK